MSSPPRARPLRLVVLLSAVAALIALVVGVVTWAAAAGEPEALGDIRWPDSGSAAVAVADGPVVASSDDPVPMASISKVVTALMVLEERPLQPGETGGDYWFTEEWDAAYREYLARGESALKIPVGGMLTERQLLDGMLVGSACNYADILVASIWGDEAAFAEAAARFVDTHGLDGITMVEPTGIDPRNTATPAALIALGRLALAHPVVAEIVAQTAVDLPGAGIVENTNDLLADAGVVGVKTGTLEGSSLLSAKDVPDGDGGTVRVFAVVLGQPDDDARFTASRALYAQAEAIVSR
ncbi:D-alanyl-D-alanine carboxypeptidase family protein [Microbacterium gilvum]|uniref:Peptidase S11 D-alanyl-D-alanine carboxypeptidase A N-terminal domain-containing protein n=1 Tax=Microbacterium gilvum TaxID=1336204 RepID=A0ABP8ZRF1_9MICO